VDTGQQLLGQLVVVVGIALVAVGVAIAATQAAAGNAGGMGTRRAISRLVKRPAPVVVAIVGLVVVLGGLQVMNHGVKTDVNGDLKNRVKHASSR
jgi:hypothetical protein